MRKAKAPTCNDSDDGEVSAETGDRPVEMLYGEIGLPILMADLSQIPK
jgi:hypothetical protein